ncbi:MAG: PAS domain-containing protein [Erythrobacter sp.]
MDTLRGDFSSSNSSEADAAGVENALDRGFDDASRAPQSAPPAIGQDERRLQVRAYNHWATLLEERMFPLIEELDPANLPDFGPYSALIDFTSGIEDPAVQFIGDQLAAECGANGPIERLSDVPPRSLLSRITDHYMQILANRAPIGFEAEFVNQRGSSTLYRGILLPFSSDGETIDFLYGVINWKELADAAAADELLLEIDQALDLDDAAQEAGAEQDVAPLRRAPDALTIWADSPASENAEAEPARDHELPRPAFGAADEEGSDFAAPDCSQYGLDNDFDEDYDEDEGEDESAHYNFASLANYLEAPVKKAIDPTKFALDETMPADFAPDNGGGFDDSSKADAYDFGPDDFGPEDFAPDDAAAPASLYDWLAAAREMAHAANTTEDRSRSALYAAVGRAYDFALAAQDAPEDYAELIAQSGLTMQDRAPMTPVVKLVFGADYDKTRLTEYAAVLSHARRLELERGTLAQFLNEAEGGLKGVVKAERRLRREEAGQPVSDETAVREALAAKLRELEALSLEALDGAGPEFALVMIRRDDAGCTYILGELPEDIGQIERAARKLVG